MALSRQALSDYDATLSRMERAAADYVRRRVGAYMASYPEASVAEVRDFAIGVVDDAVGAYGDAASTAAADLYDELAEASPKTLPTAAVDTSDVSGYVDKEVRYQAGKLVDGAPSAFAAAVAACASDQVSRRANATMAGNVQRDHIRYARVPMGGETCTFCAMLASRGFVYRSAKSAGEGTHWHRNCRCKVVPETAGTVEGYDPDEWYGRWKEFERIDADGTMTEAQRQAAKRALTGRPVTASHTTLMKGLPSGRSGQTLKDAACDVYTTSDGISLIFPQGMDAAKQAMTPDRALELLDKVPGEVRDKMQREVYFVDYENPQDAYWRKRYKNFTGSYATGGEEITFYASASHDDDYVVRTFCHEAGHYIDAKNGTKKNRASSLTKWKRAMNDDLAFSGLAHPTRYAANANTEDFAESLAEYCANGVSFRKNFPNRAAALDAILAKRAVV